MKDMFSQRFSHMRWASLFGSRKCRQRLRVMVWILLLLLLLLGGPFMLLLAHMGLERVVAIAASAVLIALLVIGSLRTRHTPRPPGSRASIEGAESKRTLSDAA